MARVRGGRESLRLEIQSKIIKDIEIHRKGKAFAEDVADYAQRRALRDMDRGYATGEFVASIKVERNRSRLGRFVGKSRGLPAWRVVTHDPKAHMLEYGTDIDNPDSRSPWGRFTPTPEYATFAKTAFHFGGTPDGG